MKWKKFEANLQWKLNLLEVIELGEEISFKLEEIEFYFLNFIPPF